MYLRMVANIAFGDNPDGSDKVPAASAEEIKIFEQARRHLPATIYDVTRWKTVVGPDLWPQVVYVLNRGGRFQGYQQAYKDGQLANKYGKMVGIYFEKSRDHQELHDRQDLCTPMPTSWTGPAIVWAACWTMKPRGSI